MNSHNKQTLEQIFQHPISHNLEWHDIRTLFESLGEIEEEHNGNIKVTVSGHAVVFHSPVSSKVLTADQVSQVRHLLQTSGNHNGNGAETHLLLVIDHQEAKIYHTELAGTVPEKVLPYDPTGHKSHVHSAHDYPGENELPSSSAYYEAIAQHLKEGDKVLIFGSGSGSSNAADLFVDWLGDHHPQIVSKLIASVRIDPSHLSEGQLLAAARKVYAE